GLVQAVAGIQFELRPDRSISTAFPSKVQAVAGVQFVLRLPHHAADKLAGAPAVCLPSGERLRRRAQRMGEMDQWALWAHGGGEQGRRRTLSKATERLKRLLSVAGFDLTLTEPSGDGLEVTSLDLAGAAPAKASVVSVSGPLAEVH